MAKIDVDKTINLFKELQKENDKLKETLIFIEAKTGATLCFTDKEILENIKKFKQKLKQIQSKIKQAIGDVK